MTSKQMITTVGICRNISVFECVKRKIIGRISRNPIMKPITESIKEKFDNSRKNDEFLLSGTLTDTCNTYKRIKSTIWKNIILK